MPYVATTYAGNAAAPLNKWVCSPGSGLGPFATAPRDKAERPGYCGQCVSYVRTVCPSLPVTGSWVKGALVKDATGLKPGTVIATFNAQGKYEGHAAIFVSKDDTGVLVYDQWIYGHAPKAVGQRRLRWDVPVLVNDASRFSVVE